MPTAVRLLILPGEPVAGATSSALWSVLERSHLPVLPDVVTSVDDLAHHLLDARGQRTLTILCGGPPLAQDGVLSRVRDALDRPWPGFAEAVRRLWAEELGARAVLADAAAGRCGPGFLVAVPGPASIAARAVETLVLPLVEQAPSADDGAATADGDDTAADTTADTAAAATDDARASSGRVDLVELGGTAAPDPGPAKVGWQAALDRIGGTLDRDRWGSLPEAFDRIAPARNVLDTAGERARCTLADGREFAAFGFPDLLRKGSKVLLVGEGEPLAQVVALHRHPVKVGVVVHGDDGLLPGADSDLDRVALERTGREPPGFGTLFAVDGSVVYYLRERRVLSWDGSRERDEGTATQAFASLLLRWSQR